MKQSLEKLNIALVHEWITNVAGAERVLLTLLKMFPNADVFTAVYDENKAREFKKYNVRTSFLQKIPFMKSKRTMMIPFTPLAFEQFDLSKYDLVISTTTMAAKGVITKPSTTHISYCHTPPRYLWEPSLDPRANYGLLKSLRQSTMHKMRIWDRLAADRVDYFIANSKYIADRIKKYYRRDSKVINPGVNVCDFSLAKPSEIKDYFLHVGRLVDYKHCDIIVEAFNNLGLPLKIIGRGPNKKKLQKIAKSNIEFLGFLSDDEVRKYYRQAKAFVFAAEEDFGIVPVEAMASGRPVIAYGQGGIRDTVVDKKTGIFFGQQTAESLEKAVRSFFPDDFSPELIRAQAEKFSNEIFEKNFTSFVEDVLDKENKDACRR